MSKAPRPEPEVQSITSVPESLDADQARRAKVYLIQMAIRLVCFIAAILCLTMGPAWLGWTLAVGAVVLPYTAVVFVNAGPNRAPRDAQAYVPEGPAALPAAGDGPDDAGRPPSGTRHTVIDGDALLDDVRDEPLHDEPLRDEPVEKKN
ncbi:DUF3099 domain-containing protein [Myceligenerans pegani]|uniref:DUF3099 domain-containing protein n=1 Tax=Myceligenerans pegani TaxID=2776917 RepID=A0ABR9MY67_9MICO|nr:DUF3099 domain-containing protein [Myceligenerans sp. TRM 65318]MBE1875737.1 DUF3099 domain-containing protein [Myceligenerans sp. TRM 65318]MBE3018008.1 DUF3099 domain-containing protein [Myceligenerans sp. TRM 65318]